MLFTAVASAALRFLPDVSQPVLFFSLSLMTIRPGAAGFEYCASFGAWDKAKGSRAGTSTKGQGTCLSVSADRCIRQLQW